MAETTPSPQKGKSESKSAQSEVAQRKEGSGFSLEDNRAETNVQLKVKEGMDSRALSAPDLTGNKSFTIQKKAVPPVVKPTTPSTSPTITAGNVQLKGKSPEESELPVQASSSVDTAQFAGAGESGPPPASGSSSNGNQPRSQSSANSPATTITATPPVGAAQLAAKPSEEKEAQPQASSPVETAQFAGAGESSPPSSGSASNSGLPQNLKSGVEKLSGQSMSDVTVHQNSEKPAQLNAHAYAKGSDIHLGPGQEKHLPHEAWHVAQQKQGRVQPTKQLKGKVPVNDDKGLEQEADVMGAKALEVGRKTVQANADQPVSAIGNTVQLEKDEVQTDVPKVSEVPLETVTPPSEASGDGDQQEMAGLFDEHAAASAREDAEEVSEEPSEQETVEAENAAEEAEESIADQIKNTVAATPPPKYTKRAFIITTDSLRKIKESAKAYEGIKTEHGLKAGEAETPAPESENEATTSEEVQAESAPVASTDTVQRIAIFDKVKSFLGIGKKEETSKKADEPKGKSSATDKEKKKKELTPEDRISKILEKGQFDEKVEGTPSMAEKFKSFFGFGKKTNLELAPELSPKKFKFPTGIPVRIDPSNKIAGWSAVKVDMAAIEKYSKPENKTVPGGDKIWQAIKGVIKADNSEGYFPFKKLAVTDLDLNNTKGVRLERTSRLDNFPPQNDGATDKEKAKGADGREYVWVAKSKAWKAPSGDLYAKDSGGHWTKQDKPLSERLGKKVVSTLSGFEGIANTVNSAIDSGTEKINEATEFAKEKAKDVAILKNVELEVPAGGTRLIPGQGFFVSLTGGYDFGIEGADNKFLVTPSLMVNIKDSSDWFVEYRGTMLEVPKFSIGSEDSIKVDVDLGTLSHQPTEGGSVFKCTDAVASVTFLNQTFGVKVEEASLNTAATTSRFTYKIAEFSGNLNILNTNLLINVEQPSFNDGKVDFAKASGEIPEVTPFSGVKFTEVKAAMVKNEDASKNIAGSAKFNVTNEYIEEASGEIGILKKGKGDTNLILSDGKLKAIVFGQTLQLNGVTYDSSKEPGVINMESGQLDLDIENPLHEDNITGIFTVNKAKLSSNSFTYDKATGKVGDIEAGHGLSFKSIEGEIDKTGEEELFRASGNISLDHRSVQAFGKINISQAGESETAPIFSLSEGKMEAEFFGTKMKASNIQYESKKNKLSAEAITADVLLPLPTGAVTKKVSVTEPTWTKGEFSFGVATVDLGELQPMPGVPGLKFIGTTGTLKMIREKPVFEGKSQFNMDVSLGESGDTLNTTGTNNSVTLGFSDNNKFFYVKDLNLEGKLAGGDLEVKNIFYSHANNNLIRASAAELKNATILPHDKEALFNLNIINPSYSSEKGFGFNTATGGFSGDVKTGLDGLVIKNPQFEAKSVRGNANYSATAVVEYTKEENIKINAPLTVGHAAAKGYYGFIKGGTLDAQIFDQELSVAGVRWTLQNKERLSAQNAALDLKFNDPKGGEISGNIKVNRPRIDQGTGFTYDQAKLAFGDIDMGYGIKFENLNGQVQKQGKDKFEGNAKFSGSNNFLEDLEGEVNVTKEGDGAAEFVLKDGVFKVDIFGNKIAATNVQYQSASREFSANDLSGKLNVPTPDTEGSRSVGFTITKPKYASGNFSFEKAELDFNEDIVPIEGVSFNKTKLGVHSKRDNLVYSGSTTVEIKKGPVKNADGKVHFGASKGKPFFYLKNGTLTGDAFGEADNLKASGLTYSYSNKNKITIAKASLEKVNIFGNLIDFALEGAQYTDDQGFTFAKASATLAAIQLTEGIHAKNIVLSVEKLGEDDYKVTSSGEFNAGGTYSGMTLTTSGKIEVTREKKTTTATLLNAGMNLKTEGQEFDLSAVTHADGVLSVGSATAKLNLPFTDEGHKLTAQVTGASFGKAGFNFTKATVNPNLSVDFFGLASANLNELTLERNAIGTKASATGGLSVGGGTILGKPIPQLSGQGTLSHQFKNDKSAGETEKELVGVGGKLPAIDLPKDLLPSGLWPLGISAPIPIIPGLNAELYAGVSGGLKAPDTSLSLTKVDKETYKLVAHASKLQVGVSVELGAGISGGASFLTSLMVGVEAAGSITADANMKIEKDFRMGAPKKEVKIEAEEDPAFTYNLDGNIVLAANLVFKATALYFLSKKWKKELSRKELGRIKKTHATKWEFIKPVEPMRPTDAELMVDISSNLPASLKGKSKEELNAIPQHKKLTNDNVKDVMAVFKNSGKTEDNPTRLFDYGVFNYNRFDWEKLQDALPIIINQAQETENTPEVAIDAPMPEVTPPTAETPDQAEGNKPGWFDTFKKKAMAGADWVKAEIKYSQALQQVGEGMNSKHELIQQYIREADKLKKIRKKTNTDLEMIINIHLLLAETYLQANNELKRKVHSSILGDKNQQRLTQIRRRNVGAKGLKESAKRFYDKITQTKTEFAFVNNLDNNYLTSKQGSKADSPPADSNA